MIKDGNLAIRHIARQDLATLVPQLNDLDVRGANFVWGQHVDMAVYALLREQAVTELQANTA